MGRAHRTPGRGLAGTQKLGGQIGQLPDPSRQWASTKKATSKENAQPDMDCQNSLNLKAGEWGEIRSREEILATLDEHGCLENLPLMPEMLNYGGKHFRVYKRADKTCHYILGWSIRREANPAHLEGVS